MDDLRNVKLEQILLNAPNIKCDCGGTIFETATVFKRVSAIVSPSGRDEVVPVDVYVCKKCGKVLSDMFKSEENCRKTVGEDVPISKHYKSVDKTAESNLIV